jgi:hypothetical protein
MHDIASIFHFPDRIGLPALVEGSKMYLGL